MVVRDGGRVAAFVFGYRRPESHDTVFVWQVAVAASHRRRGLASKMLHRLADHLAPRGVRWLEATATPPTRRRSASSGRSPGSGARPARSRSCSRPTPSRRSSVTRGSTCCASDRSGPRRRTSDSVPGPVRRGRRGSLLGSVATNDDPLRACARAPHLVGVVRTPCSPLGTCLRAPRRGSRAAACRRCPVLPCRMSRTRLPSVRPTDDREDRACRCSRRSSPRSGVTAERGRRSSRPPGAAG